MGVKMNYFFREIAVKETGYYLEITIAVIIGILLILSIIMLSLIKKLKDK